MSVTARLREILRMRWTRVSDHEAGQVLSRRAEEARLRAELTLREKQDAKHAELRALRAAGWPQVSR